MDVTSRKLKKAGRSGFARHLESKVFCAMLDKQREHNKRQVMRSRLRQHLRVLEILNALPHPAGLSVASDLIVELASTRVFALWRRIDWAAVKVECEATLSFDAGTKDIKRRGAVGLLKGLIPSGLSKKERVEWFARHARPVSNVAHPMSLMLPGEQRPDLLPMPDSPFDDDALAASDSAAAAAANTVLSERVAQREARAAQRTLRKRLQVESFAVVLHAIIEVLFQKILFYGFHVMSRNRPVGLKARARHSLSWILAAARET
jgi:hypothetical protein